MSEQKHKTAKLITGEDELKELIKSIIRKELEEMTGTSAIGAVTGPAAFSEKGQSHGKKATDAMTSMGFTVAKEIDEKKVGKKVGKKSKLDPVGKEDDDVDNDGIPATDSDEYLLRRRLDVSKKTGKKDTVKKIKKHLDDLEKLDEAVSRYNRFKTHPMKDRSKISMVVQEITKMLREVDFLMTVNEKLKTELNIPKDDLWKRTESRIAEIRSRLKSLESRLKTFHR
jgi:hypothetical protein